MQTYDKYKPTGDDWIGDIPEHWKVKKLKYLVELVDKTVSKTSFLIGVENIESKTGKLINLDEDKTYQGVINEFQRGDVLFNKLRPYLAKVYFAQQSGGYIGELLNFRAGKEVHNKFLYYRVISANFIDIVDSSTTGTKMPRASWDDFIGHLLIALPPLPEQTAIADYLDEKIAQIDSLIANKVKLIELLKEERTAIINQAATCGIDPHAKLKPSGIAWLEYIPEHWEVKKLKMLSHRIGDGIHSTPVYDDNSDIFFVNGNNLVSGAILISNMTRRVEENDYAKLKIDFNSDTVFLSINGTIGNLAFYNNEKIVLGKSAAFIECNNKLNKRFAFYALQSGYVLDGFETSLTGTTIKNLSLHTLKNTKIAIPSIQEQQQIVEFIETATGKIDATIEKIEKEIGFVREYRTALISEVVTGKIKVV